MESYGWINYHLADREHRIAKPMVLLSLSFKTKRQVGIRRDTLMILGAVVY